MINNDFRKSHTVPKNPKGDPLVSSSSEDTVNSMRNSNGVLFSVLGYSLEPMRVVNTEAKRGFATHDEDIYYFNMRIYYFNRMRIYSTVQLCSITSLWHSGQHSCRAIGRLQVRISLGFWLLSKRRSL